MFTLAHELAHIWLGRTGLSDISPSTFPTDIVEMWCDRVAAEILVPLNIIRTEYRRIDGLLNEMQCLARYFKVSTLVILRRIYDAGYITQDELWPAYRTELKRLLNITKGRGGNYYRSQTARVSRRFARALIANTLEGQTLHRDAFRLLGLTNISTFNEMGSRLGIV